MSDFSFNGVYGIESSCEKILKKKMTIWFVFIDQLVYINLTLDNTLYGEKAQIMTSFIPFTIHLQPTEV